MLGALFGLIMLGVGWLVIWSCVDHSKPSEIWWPFAMRTIEPDRLRSARGSRRTDRALANKWKSFATVAGIRLR